MAQLLNFTDNDLLGSVTHVDTEQIVVEIENTVIMGQICVGNLVAIETGKRHEFLISLIDKVTRKYIDDFDDTESEENEIMVSSADYVKVSIIGTYHSVLGDLHDVFKRGVDTFPQIESKCYCISSINLQNFMNILSRNIETDKRLKIGSFMMDASADAVLDGNKFFQRHAAILGSTGSGKSWCVANILEKASTLQHANIIVFDMHGEYQKLAVGSNPIAERYRIAGPGDLETPTSDVLFLPYWLLNREELLSMILDRSDSNAPNQASRFTLHIRELKAQTLTKEGRTNTLKTFTVDSPIPFLMSDLIDKLKDDDTRKGIGKNGAPVKGDWEGKLTRFISRLEAKLDDKTYGFMFQPIAQSQNYTWLSEMLCNLLGYFDGKPGIKIIDFSEVPSDVLPVVTGTLARLLYNIQFWMDPTKRTPFTLICDEAHLYLPIKDEADAVQKQALYNFERIAKEGRKYGVSILAVSQRPADVSKTILSQCNNFVVLRLTNEKDKGVIRNLLPDSLKSTIEFLPLLDVGEALVVGDAILLPSKILLDKPSDEHQPISATKDFWDEWDSKIPDNDAVTKAVEALRSQSRA
ncbi:ATP-binding protein [Enterocloster clostridioformis]|uniref:Type IV secretory pathway, VirB4 components n=1 Tax=Enterocloster clostridioformis TaxID=1531 RepID=A0A174URA6_9FIRM|nr:ATP-binding protein [Enterocloster clostridioformis]CUQ23411.1 Type IV secretory pathway%2C VirB4 components [Enterocloster clostridioformis]